MIDKDLAYIAGELNKDKNMEYNLKLYNTGLRTYYETLGFMKLSMNSFTLLESMRDDPERYEGRFAEIYRRFRAIVKERVIAGTDVPGEAVAAIDALRADLCETMEVVTAFADIFRNLEYVMNRVEYRFKDEKVDAKYYGMYFTNDLMHYIFADQDKVAINNRIRDIVGQLPMRLTREHLYDNIRMSFNLYHGAQKGTIDDFAEAILSGAKMIPPAKAAEYFPIVYKDYEKLIQADFGKLTDASEYEVLHQALEEGISMVRSYADDYVLLMQMVNDAYTVILTREGALEEGVEIAKAKEMLEYVASVEAQKVQFDEMKAAEFMLFEGKQERIVSEIAKGSFGVDSLLRNKRKLLSDLGVEEQFEALDACSKLQSGSDFVDLKTNLALELIPEDSYADEAAEKLIESLSEELKGLKQPVRRAVMASVMSQLPVLFNNTDEIQSYINVSLEQCSDEAEQLACLQILKELMNV